MTTDFLKNVHDEINEAVLRYFDAPQETVTHYTSPDGFINIIQGKELWLGNINNVNDTTELDYAFKEIIYPCIRKYNFSNQTLRSKIFSLISRLKERRFTFAYDDEIKFKKVSLFVFSTSFENNSTMLWELYCKNNASKGYAITFDKNKFTDNLCEHNFKSQTNRCEYDSSGRSSSHLLIEGKVIYKRQKQEEIINDYLSHLEYAIEQQNSEKAIQAILDIYVQKFILLALFMKDADFDKENEYRFAVVCDDEYLDTDKNSPPYLVFGTNSGHVVSRLSVPFGAEIIKAITISPFISDVKTLETTKYFLEKNGVPQIDIIHNSPKIRK